MSRGFMPYGEGIVDMAFVGLVIRRGLAVALVIETWQDHHLDGKSSTVHFAL